MCWKKEVKAIRVGVTLATLFACGVGILILLIISVSGDYSVTIHFNLYKEFYVELFFVIFAIVNTPYVFKVFVESE